MLLQYRDMDMKGKNMHYSHKVPRIRRDGMRIGQRAITKDLEEQIVRLFMLGMSDNEVAETVGLTRSAFYKHIERHPESLIAKKEHFKKKRVLEVRERLYQLTNSPDENIRLKACIDYLNRYEGKPKEKLELSGEISTTASQAIEENLVLLAKLYERTPNE